MAAPNLKSPTTITGKTIFTALATTTETTLVTNSASSGKAFRVTLLAIANVDGAAAADATVTIYNLAATSGGTAFKLLHTVSVPADSTFAPIGRDASLWLEEDRRITVQASAANDLHVILSYEEVS
jgi:hypothetical protein